MEMKDPLIPGLPRLFVGPKLLDRWPGRPSRLPSPPKERRRTLLVPCPLKEERRRMCLIPGLPHFSKGRVECLFVFCFYVDCVVVFCVCLCVCVYICLCLCLFVFVFVFIFMFVMFMFSVCVLLCLCVLFVPVFCVRACVVAVVVPVVYKSVSLYRVCFFPQGPSLFHNSVVARVQCTRRVWCVRLSDWVLHRLQVKEKEIFL